MAYSTRVLGPTTRENTDPKKSKEVTDLEDELALSNIEWIQSFKELRAKIEKLEQTVEGLEHVYIREINYNVSILLNEMIEFVNDELMGSKRTYTNDYVGEERKQKQPRL